MKKILLLYLILTFSMNLFGQNENFQNDKVVEKFEIITQKLNKQIAEQDSLMSELKKEFIQLRRENDMSKTTLELSSNTFGTISTYFSVIAILLSIIVIAIPVINYFLVLKPNQKIVGKVENLETEVLNKIEGNFEKYFENLRKKKTQNIISLLDDRTKISEVTSYFLINESDNLEEKDIKRIIEFIKENPDIENFDSSILHSTVKYSGFDIVEKFYKSIFESEDKENFKYGIEFLVADGLPDHINYVQTIITANKKGHHLLIDFYKHISDTYLGHWNDKKAPEKRKIGESYIKMLFDNDKIIDGIKDDEIPVTFGFEEHPININRINQEPFIRDTKYYKIYLEENDKKYK